MKEATPFALMALLMLTLTVIFAGKAPHVANPGIAWLMTYVCGALGATSSALTGLVLYEERRMNR